MDITYIAETCFRIRTRDGSVLVAPTPGVMTQDADTALLHIPDGEVPSKIRVKRTLLAPGEYEYDGILLHGHGSYIDQLGDNTARNLIWVVAAEGVVVCHLGLLGHALTPEETEAFGVIDVLLVPVGAKTALKGDQVADLIGMLEPKICVPYTPEGSDEAAVRKAVGKIASELGVAVGDFKPKISVTRSNMNASGSEVAFVLLEPKR